MEPRSKRAFILAGILKIWLPIGVAMSLTRIVYVGYFKGEGISIDLLGSAFAPLFIMIFFGLIVGLIQSRNL